MIRKLVLLIASAVWSVTAAYGGSLPCPGDCNDDGVVTVDEIITGVNIALGAAPIGSCPRFDVSGDQQVTVDEILQGITAALEGCASAATPTPTAVPTPGETSVARRAAGMITTSTQAFLALPDLVSTLIDEVVDASEDIGAGGGSERSDCPEGGDRTLSCEQRLDGTPPLPRAEYEMEFDDCESETEDGTKLEIDGRINFTSPRGQFCGLIPEGVDFDLDVDQIVIVESGGALDTITTLTDVDGDIAFSERDAGCAFEQFDLDIDGDLLFEAKQPDGTPVATVAAEMSDTRLRLHVDDYGRDCRPEDYTLKVSGDVEFTADSASVAADYDDYVLEADAVSDGVILRIRGGVTSECFGPKVTFATEVDMHLGDNVACPDAGQVSVTADDAVGVIYYSAEGVEVDRDGDGTRDESFPDCRDPELFECPA